MIYEWRVYEIAPGKAQALHDRFASGALPIWEKYGIKVVGFWTYLIGGPSDHLVYMLEWESLEQREKLFPAFQNDPEWVKIRAETEKDGSLVTRMYNSFLRPTPYSPMK